MSVDIKLVKQLPMFADANDQLSSRVASTAILKNIPKGQQIAYEGMQIDWFFVLLSGNIRVYKVGETGKEITLFNIVANESCIFSILGQTKYPAYATAQTDTLALMIPSEAFRQWVGQYATLRDYIFQSLSARFNDILTTIDQIIFQSMDSRIAQFILENCSASDSSLNITHEQISHELGTNRVVVSRVLEKFEEENVVTLSRGCITLRDRARLTAK